MSLPVKAHWPVPGGRQSRLVAQAPLPQAGPGASSWDRDSLKTIEGEDPARGGLPGLPSALAKGEKESGWKGMGVGIGGTHDYR